MIRAIPTDETTEVALHEAGHAAIAIALNVRLHYATTYPGGRSAGSTLHCHPLSQEKRKKITIGGLAAQVHACLGRNPGADPFAAYTLYEGGSQNDIAALEGCGIWGSAVMELMYEGLKMLEPLWPRVEALARELIKAEHRTLYHDEASWIFHGLHHKLDTYRTHRRVADPPQFWLERFAPSKAPPWFENTSAFTMRSSLERLRSRFERIFGG